MSHWIGEMKYLAVRKILIQVKKIIWYVPAEK